MSRCLLSEIAEIQTGYSFRAAIDYDEAGSARVIQMRDLADDFTVNFASLGCIDIEVIDSQRVAAGDIVIRTRGDSASSAIVVGDPGPAVVAAPLLRIRVADVRVSAAYLNWYINQPPAQAYFAKNAEGSNVKMISKRALAELEVEVPPTQRQQAIVELAGLSARARVLQKAIDARRDNLLSQLMMHYAEGGTR